jgi:multimeric flavodoxin WrbA
MRVLGINGSHRAGKGTSALLNAALGAAAEQGAETELIELAKLNIGYCIGCNACLGHTTCTLSDDMDELFEKMREADAILLASPDYFGTVTASMKNFMDRTRPFHMVENVLAGKVGGSLATAGLDNCGGENTLATLDSWFATHGMLAVHPRPAGAPLSGGVVATGFAGLNEEGAPQWRSVKADPIGFKLAHQLGVEVVTLVTRLS